VDLQNIHFGGGTPILLTAEDLRDLLSSLLQAYGKRIEEMQTVTIEARPDSLTAEKIRDLRAIGFNRICLGVQMFNQGVLKRLQRNVDVEHCLRCYEWIRSAGFEDWVDINGSL
jgi:oxygen-independent coproporphyrinogen-3 oxidase